MDRRAVYKSFFGALPDAFSFLVQDHNFTMICGLARYRGGRVMIAPIPDNMNKLPDDAYATCRFEDEGHIFEFSFDESDHILRASLTYDRAYRFSFSDLKHLLLPSKAIKMSAYNFNEPITTPTQLFKKVAHLKQVIQADLDLYLSPPDSFLDQALSYQNKILPDRLQTRQHDELTQACAQALEAFEQGDYKRAIMLYRPFKDQLPEEDQRIFSIALMRLEE